MDSAAYRSQGPFTERQSATLVITCTSNASSPYVREFLERHLGLADGTSDSLAVPGGPQFLLLVEYLPKFAWAGQRWVKFLVERHRLKRAVLISHQDCAWHDDDRMIPALLHRLTGGAAQTRGSAAHGGGSPRLRTGDRRRGVAGAGRPRGVRPGDVTFGQSWNSITAPPPHEF